MKNLKALDYNHLEYGYESLRQQYPSNMLLVLVHGRMKPADKDFEISVCRGKTQIMVATTVIKWV
ncbi:MAG: hypothetical protein R2777_09045 [Chitinophagales bacterium]